MPGPSICQELRFQRFTIQDGLSNDGTYWLESLIQDREGFLWFTTFNGLNRFDGKYFKKYQYDQNNQKGLGDNLTTAICEADDGKIWVGSSSGIYIFDPQTETFENLRHDPRVIGTQPANPHSLCGNDVNFIKKDRDGNMWIGTGTSGVCRWSHQQGHFDDFNGYFGSALSFFQQKNGTIWVGDFDGLHQKIAGKDEFQKIPIPEDYKRRNFHKTSGIAELHDGSLLITSRDFGLWTYNPRTQEFADLSQSFKSSILYAPNCLFADQQGKIWMGGVGEVFCYDPEAKEFKVYRHNAGDPASVPMFGLASGGFDAAGSLWFVTSGGGVIVAHSPKPPFEKLGSLYPGEVIRLDEDRLLINGFDQRGIMDARRGTLTATGLPASLTSAWTESLALSGKNELWVQQKGADHVKVFNLKTGETRQVPGRTPWLRAGPDGRIWSGFKYFDEAVNQWVNVYPNIEGLPDSAKLGRAVVDIHFSAEYIVWLATNTGIFQYNLASKQGKKYPLYPGDRVSAEVVHKIHPGQAGRFYLITSNGMSMYDPASDRFLSFNEGNGLLHNQVTTVVEDAHGNAWIATTRGMHRLDLATRRFTNYDINDGLPGVNFNFQRAFRDDAGFLYFSINEELIRFHPDSLNPKAYVAPVHLLDFFLNHKAVRTDGNDSFLKQRLRFTKEIPLRHDQADFGFSFIMPVFYKAGEVEYFYQLSPYDEDWKSAGTNSEIHYTNMPPGNYTFHVKAKTADGFWNKSEASIKVQISPPWWQTWWAYLGYFVLLAAAAYGFYKFQLNRQLEHAEARRLVELDTLKTRLYTNITHEFRTPLTVIMGMTEQLTVGSWQSAVSDSDRGKLKGVFSLILRNSKNLLRLINQLLDLSKLDSGTMRMDVVQGDIINYLQYLTESFHSMAHEKKVRLTFYSEIPELVMDFDEVKIQHIIYNLLSNALKFTKEDGKVVLHANQVERNGQPFLKLKVQDTGIGIPEGQLNHIFDRFFQADNSSTRKGEGTGIGLALTKELVELMGGSISVESSTSPLGERGAGTNFTMLLPIRLGANTPMPQTEFPSSQSLAPELVPDLPAPIRMEATDDHEKLSNEKPVLLLIEDNADVVTYIVGLLEKDYDITTAPNGQVGIEKAFEIIPDIIVSDVMMPEKDGYEVCEALKHDERTSHIPIILLTAKAEETDRITGLRKGADAYLMKPFNKEELYVRLEKLLELRRALQQRYAGERFDKSSRFVKSKTSEPTLDDLFLQKLQNTVMEHIDQSELGAEQLSRAVNLSQSRLYRKMAALTGEPPNAFIRKIRLHQAKEMLETTELNISEIAYSVGFNDPNYFSRAFAKEFGNPPSYFRN